MAGENNILMQEQHIQINGIKKLNTAAMTATAKHVADTINRYEEVRQKVRTQTMVLQNVWLGEGRKSFSTDYNILYRQLEDISGVLYDLRKAILQGEAAYMKADEKLKKEMIKRGPA